MLDFTQAEMNRNLIDCFRTDKRPDAFNTAFYLQNYFSF